MIFLLTLIVSVALIYLVTVVRERLRFLRHVDRIPGPKGLPLIGCALEFKHTNEMLHQLHGYMKEYGNVVRVQVGQTHLVFVADPALLEKLMSSTRVLDKTPDYMFLRNWLGTGLLLSTGAKWQKRRKILTPTFHFHMLEQFVEAFDRNANLLIRKLDAAVGRESVDIQPYVNFYTMDVICETAMGTSMNVQLEGHSSDYVRAANEMGRILVVRTMSAYKRYDLFYRFTADCRAERRACDVLHAMTESVIKRKRSALSRRKKGAATNNNSDAGRDEFGIKTKVAFLDLLLQCTVDGKKLTDEEIREEVDTFMYAGQDTVSIAISFALLCLAQNPAAQSKAYAELYSIFGKDKHRAATHKELLEMKYLELAIKETLRLYPSVPIYGRHLTTDYEWDGQVYPTGLTVLFFAYALHRDPKLHDDPDRFLPERFVDNRHEKHGFTYLPFSAGPRNCIGQKFAMLEMKSALSKILRNFELLPVDGYEPRLLLETVLKSENGICVRLRRR